VPWPEIALRLTLIAGLFVAAVSNAAGWVTGPLGIIAIAATAELAVRPYAAKAIDRLLLACGATLTTLILVGLVLNLLPWGLTRTTWAAAWTIVSIGILAWRRGLKSQRWKGAGWTRPMALSAFLASVIVVGAGLLAVAGFRDWGRQPALAFSLVSANAGIVVVEIDATSTTETYEIEGISEVSGAQRYISAPLTIKSDGTGERVRERVPVNMAGVWTIRLESADSGTVVRWLRVNVR
jgi:hypothetical protein